MKFTFQPEARPLDGFTIKRAIHRGGFGEVYYALTDAGKEVAIKLLRQHLDVELRGVSQCLNLKHPNLVTIFDVKQDGDGDHWVIMEYVGGKNLAQLLDDAPHGMPLEEVSRWLHGITQGLAFLHDRGIVHRDLKPGNLFIENGIVKIGDIGLSKFITESHRSAQTQSVGTVYYMAPEIAHGRYGREVDVYSLGILLYELITGRVPFDGESAGEILMRHLSERPDLSPIPQRLRPVLAQALEKDPRRRTASAEQLWHDFQRAVRGVDRPHEVPAHSFLNDTLPDSSFVRRERAAVARGPYPEPMPRHEAERLGWDRARRSEYHRDQWRNWMFGRPVALAPPLRPPHLAPPTRPNLPAPPIFGFQWVTDRWFWWIAVVIGSILFLRIGRGVSAEWLVFTSLSAMIVYGLFRFTSFAVKGLFLDGGLGEPSRAPAVDPQHGAAQTVPGAVAVKVHVATHPSVHPAVLGPDTPRLLSSRQRVSELSTSLAIAPICSGVLTAAIGLIWGQFNDVSQAAQFGVTGALASALILTLAKTWEGTRIEPGLRRTASWLVGAVVGIACYGLSQFLLVDFPRSELAGAMFDHIGEQRLIERGSRSTPTLAGYITFFMCLIGFNSWWKQADSFRSRRLSIWPLFTSSLLGLAVTIAFAFPTSWAVMWAAMISATVQLSATWAPPATRAAMMEGRQA